MPNEIPIETGGDLVERLLTGKPLETHDLATFLILKTLRPEIEVCDARYESVSKSMLQNRPELWPVTDRVIVTMRLDAERFLQRLQAFGRIGRKHRDFRLPVAFDAAGAPLAIVQLFDGADLVAQRGGQFVALLARRGLHFASKLTQQPCLRSAGLVRVPTSIWPSVPKRICEPSAARNWQVQAQVPDIRY